MNFLDLTDFDLFLKAMFGNSGEQAIAVEELLKRDSRDVARLQSVEVERGGLGKTSTVSERRGSSRQEKL